MPLFRKRLRSRVVIRPTSWDEFIGHENIVATLRQAKESARKRRDIVRPILLWGPPGCGKTSLLRLLSLGDDMEEVSGASLRPLELTALAMRLRRGSCIIIDEIHSLSRQSQEILYPIMDDGVLLWAGEQRNALVSIAATTTEIGKLVRPLRDRFSLTLFIGRYSVEEIATIAMMMAVKLKLVAVEGGASAVATRSRGTPRWALRILEQVRDHSNELSPDTVSAAVKSLGFDEPGLLIEEREYLSMLATLGGRSSITNVAAAMGQSVDSVREIESYPVQQGFLFISSRGRTLKIKGIEYLEGLGISIRL